MIHGEDADLPRRRKVPRRVVDPASPPPAVTKLAVTTKTSPPVNRRPAPRYQPPPPGPVSPERDANSRYFSSSSSSKKRPPSSSGMAGSSRGSGIRKELKRQNTLPDLTWDLRAACQPDEMAVVEEMYVEAEPEETQIEHQSGSGKSGRDITKTKRSPVFKGNQAPSGTSKGKEKATDLSAGSESDRVVLRDASGEEMMKNLTKRITNNQSKGKQKLADGDSDITRMDVDTHITVDPDEVLNQTDSEYGFDMEYSQSFLLSVDKTAQEALAKSRPIPDSPPPPSQPRRSPRRHPQSKPQSRKQQPFPRIEDSDVEFGDILVGSSSVTSGTRGFTTQTTLIPSSPTLISPTSRRVDNKFGRRPSISRPGPGRNSAYFKGKSSTSQAHPPGSMAAPIDVDRNVMEILDSEEEEKENKPVPTRRVRRRISSDTSIIELSSEL